MSLLNSYVCPSCGEEFPFFISPSRKVRRGLLSQPDVECSHCGHVSRPKISWKNAVWSWPLAAAILMLAVWLFRNVPVLHSLYHSDPLIYGLLAGAICGAIIGIGGRRGYVLVKLEETQQAPSHHRIWKIVAAVCAFAFLIVLGFITHRWRTIIVGAIIGVAVWALFYFSAQKYAK